MKWKATFFLKQIWLFSNTIFIHNTYFCGLRPTAQLKVVGFFGAFLYLPSGVCQILWAFHLPDSPWWHEGSPLASAKYSMYSHLSILGRKNKERTERKFSTQQYIR